MEQNRGVYEDETSLGHHTMSEQDLPEHVTAGAGVAAGTIGLLLGGPFLGLFAGFGTAYYASNHTGAAGDVARAIGHVALEAKTKALELDRKHNLVQCGKDMAIEVWEKAKELDRKHNILEKSKAFLLWTWQTMVHLNQKYHLLERAVNVTGSMLTSIATKVQKSIDANAHSSPTEAHFAIAPPPIMHPESYPVCTPPPHQVVIN